MNSYGLIETVGPLLDTGHRPPDHVFQTVVKSCEVRGGHGVRNGITTMNSSAFEIQIDDLNGPEIAAFLYEHLRCLAEVSPPESRHALNLDELRRPDITFWSVRCGNDLVGCGALKELTPHHGEIKSMRTATNHLRKGIAASILAAIILEAKRRGYRRLSLETGSMDYFKPAHSLYRKFGFASCAPFATYRSDPNSVFMTREL